MHSYIYGVYQVVETNTYAKINTYVAGTQPPSIYMYVQLHIYDYGINTQYNQVYIIPLL